MSFINHFIKMINFKHFSETFKHVKLIKQKNYVQKKEERCYFYESRVEHFGKTR